MLLHSPKLLANDGLLEMNWGLVWVSQGATTSILMELRADSLFAMVWIRSIGSSCSQMSAVSAIIFTCSRRFFSLLPDAPA